MGLGPVLQRAALHVFEHEVELALAFAEIRHVDDVRRVRPVYEELPGWQTDVTGVRAMQDLPANALAYLSRIEEETGTPVTMVGVGPSRDQTILR